MKEKQPVEEQETNWKTELKSWILTLLVAVGIVLFLQSVIIVNAKIPTGSMEETISAGSRVIAGRFAYWFDSPERGDVVIFRYPDHKEVLYVKRVIGLPGDTVEVKDTAVYVNGKALTEDYLSVTTEGDFGPYTVPEGSYFMMGDNRNDSWDSRYWDNTFVTEEDILGKVYFSYFPKIKWIGS